MLNIIEFAGLLHDFGSTRTVAGKVFQRLPPSVDQRPTVALYSVIGPDGIRPSKRIVAQYVFASILVNTRPDHPALSERRRGLIIGGGRRINVIGQDLIAGVTGLLINGVGDLTSIRQRLV